MKINVETGKRAAMNDIVEALEQSELHAVFCGKDKMNPIALVFEIDAEDTKVVIRQAEKIIKARLGKSVSFRVSRAGFSFPDPRTALFSSHAHNNKVPAGLERRFFSLRPAGTLHKTIFLLNIRSDGLFSRP